MSFQNKNKKEFERIARDLLRGDGNYVVVYANIDRFKLINETYGNDVGDWILRRIHEIIDDELRWDEVSGRIMADNFGVLMRFHSLPKLDQRLYRISKQLSELTDDNGNCYGIILYFGVYVVKDDENDISAMLEHANLARKKISPSHLVPMGIYDVKESQKLGRDKALEMKMHKALEQGDFVPYLQPKYELEGESIAGAEALVRWIDPEEGMIYPDEFIDLLIKEETYEHFNEGKHWDFIVRLGKAQELVGKYYNVEDGAWTDIQERHYLWKIPDSEFNYNKAMNQSTDQNPGYTSAE